MMYNGSNSNRSSSNLEESILITHYVNPQKFSYVKCKDVQAHAVFLLQMEGLLAGYCTNGRSMQVFQDNQAVIVRYMPWSPPKLLRGVVRRRQGEKYLIWVHDYGFTLCCSVGDLWPLPEDLRCSFWDINVGGVAFIAPHNGSSWSRDAKRTFDNHLEEAIQLTFKVLYQSPKNLDFGQLMLKTLATEPFRDAAIFLIDRKYACHNDKKIMLMDSSNDDFSFELAEINDLAIKAHPRVKKMFELVAGSALTQKSLKLQPGIKTFLADQNTIYTDTAMANYNTVENTDSLSKTSKEKAGNKNDLNRSRRNLTRPETQHKKLDGLLEYRNPLLIPETGKVLSKIQSIRDNSVETALNNTSTKIDQETMISDKTNLLEIIRETETKSIRVHNLSDCLFKLETPPVRQISEQSIHECVSYQPKPYDVKNTAAASSFTSSASSLAPSSVSANGNRTDQSNSQSEPLCMNKLDRIFYDMLSKKSSGSFMPKNANRKTNPIPLIMTRDSGKKVESVVGNKDITVESLVLVHSHESVYPVTCYKELPLCKEILMAMNDLYFHSPLEAQRYAWPHLLQGGSLMLVNGSRTGRSWSYLPVLCSSVLRSIQDSQPIRWESLACGPLALLVVDSVDNAKKLSNHCDFLMRNYDTQHLKVVNAHAHSMADVYSMLLNSCGVLVATPAYLLDILNVDELTLVDPTRLKYLIFDDFDRMRLGNPQLLDEVLQKIYGMGCLTMQWVIVAQQWNSERFKKLLKRATKPLLLFGDFFTAAMYGGLKLKLILRNSALKKKQLLNILAEQEGPKKRTLIYCKSQELENLQIILTQAGHKCLGISKAINQEPHELLLVSDSLLQKQLPVKNIELLIHYNLPESWSKFGIRFHTMADSIRNYFTTPLENVPLLVTYIMLDEKNSKEWYRTMKFLEDHGVVTNELMSKFNRSSQQKSDNSQHYCPSLLSRGDCNWSECIKRHHYVKEDFQYPGSPLQQSGTIIRCKLYKAYDAAHMAVWPIKYKSKDSTSWVDVSYPSSPSTLLLKMSLGVPQNVHYPYHLNDVCFVLHHGHLRRVRIVDTPSRRPVTVQFMDHGTELLQVKPCELLVCPEKFKTLPPLALDIRLSDLVAAGEDGNWSSDSFQWVQESFGAIEGQMMQVTVDFAILDVVYVLEIALIEECRTMQTSAYKTFLRKELIRQGFAKRDGLAFHELRTMYEHRKQEMENLGTNKENLGYSKFNNDLEELEKEITSSPNRKTSSSSRSKEARRNERPDSNLLPTRQENGMFSMITTVNRYINEHVSGNTEEKKELSFNKNEINVDKVTLKDSEKQEKPVQIEHPLDSSTALLNTLIHELNTNNPLKKQHTQQFLHSIVNEKENRDIQHNKLSAKALNLDKPVEEGPQDPSNEQVSQYLQCATKAGESVHPRVKWHQTQTRIELTIEQQVPDYNLILEGNTLKYSVTTTTPPQRCILNLLGVVRIESVKQLGYCLQVKLTKADLLVYWPTLLNSLYAQQQSHWLTYDTERAQGPPLPEYLVQWKEYLSREISNNNSNPEEDEFNSSQEDFAEPGVEYGNFDSALFEDF
ncbi:putative ATP-dependent RNA helicase SoYb [Drosophila rhopaloa]|uniref:RNA helicase n=1 Tax=Drosophila rhopaloa TaxID=1041015 RepID=A0A6P4ELN5_DRORH|nr:putative ATP-dependent RNA helicase SoYb [Drosophila rhopaloa]XP_016979116.1 putative ATP-dependent RNA helicase SoYb [Drosophila rhopaloa]